MTKCLWKNDDRSFFISKKMLDIITSIQYFRLCSCMAFARPRRQRYKKISFRVIVFSSCTVAYSCIWVLKCIKLNGIGHELHKRQELTFYKWIFFSSAVASVFITILSILYTIEIKFKWVYKVVHVCMIWKKF